MLEICLIVNAQTSDLKDAFRFLPIFMWLVIDFNARELPKGRDQLTLADGSLWHLLNEKYSINIY